MTYSFTTVSCSTRLAPCLKSSHSSRTHCNVFYVSEFMSPRPPRLGMSASASPGSRQLASHLMHSSVSDSCTCEAECVGPYVSLLRGLWDPEVARIAVHVFEDACTDMRVYIPVRVIIVFIHKSTLSTVHPNSSIFRLSSI